MGHDMWDESALINAFDNVLSKYKLMHNQGGNISSNDEEKVVNEGDEILSSRNYQSYESRSSEKDDGNVAASDIYTGVVALPSENHQLESDDPDKTGSVTSLQNYQSDQTGILDTQRLEEYNKLLSRYYELEDERQRVLQQLSQFGYWDYQNSTDSGWNDHTIPPTVSASQEHQAYATPGSCSNVGSTCIPYEEAPTSDDNINNPTSSFEGQALEPEKKLNLTTDSDLTGITNS